MLYNMPPCFAVNNLVNGRKGDLVIHRKCCHGDMTGSMDAANLSDCPLCQPRHRITLTESGPVLPGRVLHIVFASTEKQMVGAHARWVIACVANIESWGYGSVCHFPRQAMGSLVDAINRQYSITIRVFRPSPLPAIIALSDLCPESISDGDTRPRPGSAHDRTESASATLYSVWVAEKRGSASFTDTMHLGRLSGHRDQSSRCRAGDVHASPGFPLLPIIPRLEA